MNPGEFYQTEREDGRRVWQESQEQIAAFVSVFDDPENPNWKYVNDRCLNVKLVEQYGGLYCPHCLHLHAVLRTQAVRLGTYSKEVWRTVGGIQIFSAKGEEGEFEKDGETYRYIWYAYTGSDPYWRGKDAMVRQMQVRITDKVAKLVKGKHYTFGQVAAWEAAKEEARDARTYLAVWYQPPAVSADCMAVTDQPRTVINPGKYASHESDAPEELWAEW